MAKKESQEKLSVKENHIVTIKEFVAINNDETNAKLLSLFFIGKKEDSSDSGINTEADENASPETAHIPEKNEINKYYLSNFTLKSRKEAVALVREKRARYSGRNHVADFFVHDEKNRKLIPFRKNDYLMYDGGHFTFDGKNYIFYDNNGIEKRRSSYADKKDM